MEVQVLTYYLADSDELFFPYGITRPSSSAFPTSYLSEDLILESGAKQVLILMRVGMVGSV